MIYLDTNILIYLMEGHERYGKLVAASLEELTQQNELLGTSSITITEFLAGTINSNLKTLQQVPRLRFIGLDEVLAEQAAELQRKHPALQIGDALHLSTAIGKQASLIFTNDRLLAKVASQYIPVKKL